MRSTRDKGECPQVAVPTVTGSTHDVREYPQWWVPAAPLAGFQWPSLDGWRSACVFRLRVSRAGLQESMLFN